MAAAVQCALAALLLIALPAVALAGCPVIAAAGPQQGQQLMAGGLPSSHPHVSLSLALQREIQAAAAARVDYQAVKDDIKALLQTSQDWWPADYSTNGYGPLFIRLAWHSAGTYRRWDGRGGADGGRQRFEPERSWADNTNLDKARKLLIPIKLRHPGLSWGDLIVLAGTVSIEAMGGPVLGFCAGRMDDADGTASLELGPSTEQQQIAPCQGTDRWNWNCSSPLGPTVIGLIYVNPEGPAGVPDPAGSAPQIRDTFGRMGMNDSETVALIGGGHAFGKTHGACPTGPGPSPAEDPTNPWPGTCGSGADKGKGKNAFTSGFEGAWTDTPTEWSNDYFHNLLDFNWTKEVSPGGHFQWRPHAKPGGPQPDNVAMLTSDVALLHDPEYVRLATEFRDLHKVEPAFAHAWYKLMTADMGPRSRCLNSDAPPAQPFQLPLPDAPERLADFEAVRQEVRRALRNRHQALPGDTDATGQPYYGALFATLAYQCASTFRATDYKGGCNGARIRFSPQKDWHGNEGLDKVLQVLADIKRRFDDTGNGALSWADLIVLAGTTAVEEAAGMKLKFCGGRTDASDADGTEFLGPRQYSNPIIEAVDVAKVMGMSAREFVALHGGLRSPSHQRAVGYSGSWNGGRVSELSNAYFTTLLSHEWVQHNTSTATEYRARGDDNVVMTPRDLALSWHAEFMTPVQEYAADEAYWKRDLAAAWTKLMNADRFRGPAGSACSR